MLAYEVWFINAQQGMVQTGIDTGLLIDAGVRGSARCLAGQKWFAVARAVLADR